MKLRTGRHKRPPLPSKLRPPVALSCIGLVALLALAACDPDVRVHGRLTSPNGQPLKVGEIRVECPDLCGYAALHSDRGDFYGSKLGRGCPLSCRLRATSVGHRDLVAPAADFCVERDGSTCSDFEVNVSLEQSP